VDRNTLAYEEDALGCWMGDGVYRLLTNVLLTWTFLVRANVGDGSVVLVRLLGCTWLLC